jgi:hypothetical protein
VSHDKTIQNVKVWNFNSFGFIKKNASFSPVSFGTVHIVAPYGTVLCLI